MGTPHNAINAWLMLIALSLTWSPTSFDPPQFLVTPSANLQDLLGNLLLFWPIAVVDW